MCEWVIVKILYIVPFMFILVNVCDHLRLLLNLNLLFIDIIIRVKSKHDNYYTILMTLLLMIISGISILKSPSHRPTWWLIGLSLVIPKEWVRSSQTSNQKRETTLIAMQFRRDTHKHLHSPEWSFLSQDGDKHWLFWIVPEYFQPERQSLHELFPISHCWGPGLCCFHLPAKEMSKKISPVSVPRHRRRSPAPHPVHPWL